MDRFGLSIKGVLALDNKLLLRKNERSEYELLGGRLEKADLSAEQRLITEFIEESGIRIEVGEQREPWLYDVGLKSVIIVPYVCRAISIPDTLEDGDGGTLHWISAKDLVTANMPQGYKDTIMGDIPHKSFSIPSKTHFKTIPNYVENSYFVEVCVKANDHELLRAPLPRLHSPRDFVYQNLGEKSTDIALTFSPISIDRVRNTIVLNYKVLQKPA